MPAIQAVIHSATRQRTRLDLAAKNAVEDCKEATRLYGREIALKMSGAEGGPLSGFAYPTVSSTYIRTFKLQDAWLAQAERTDIRETSRGFEYEFNVDVTDGGYTETLDRRTGKIRRRRNPEGNEHYAAKVQGDKDGEGQKPIHGAHGWKLFINVLDRHEWHTQIQQVIRFLKRK